jgi:hypothetical protein
MVTQHLRMCSFSLLHEEHVHLTQPKECRFTPHSTAPTEKSEKAKIGPISEVAKNSPKTRFFFTLSTGNRGHGVRRSFLRLPRVWFPPKARKKAPQNPRRLFLTPAIVSLQKWH